MLVVWQAKYFTLDELTRSQTAIDHGISNVPKGELLQRLHQTALHMDKVRELLKNRVIVTSGYRSVELNRKIPGSSNTSHHTLAYAVDFRCPGFGSPLAICKAIAASNIQYNQLIQEHNSWVHISFALPLSRRDNLTAYKVGKATRYRPGLSLS